MSLDLDMGAALLRTAGRPATYTPPAGLPVATRADVQVRAVPTPAGNAVDRVLDAYLPAADVPAPQAGATLAVGATTYRVDGLIDDDGAVVTVAVRAL